LLALLAVLVLLVGIVPAAAAAGPDADSTKLEPALQRALTANPSGTFRVIVTQQPAKDRNDRRGKSAQVEADIAGGGGRVTRRLGIVDGHAATVSGKQLAQLSRNPKIKSISLDRRIKIQQIATVPIVGTVTTALTGGLQSTNVQAANAPQVWAQGDIGQGVSVAVFDSGIAPSADLPTAIAGVDTVYGTTALNDKGGHGTHVAGIIAGNGAMSAGAYKGVAPGARVVSVKVTDDEGNATYSSIIAGIAWVLAHQRTYNIKVANISLGAAAQTGYADDPLDAAVEMLWFRGITVVASAGNRGPAAGTIGMPGHDPYVVTVGALDDNGTAPTVDDLCRSGRPAGRPPSTG